MELHRCLTTELSVAGCRKEPTFHRKSQPGRETGRSCCVKEGKMTLHNGVSFGCRSIREAPIYQVVLSFQSLSSGWKSSCTLRLIQKQVFKQLCVDWLRLRLLIDRCQHPMTDHYAHHLQDSRRRHHFAVRSIVVPGPNASLILRAVSAAFRPSLN